MPIRSPEDVPTGLYPVMPSFDSLRGRRRTATDVLVPERAAPRDEAAHRPVAAPRPAEYGDLLLLGLLVVRTLAAAPLRLARWSARQPVTCARRLLGD